MESIFVTLVVVGMIAGIFIVPFGLLANETYKAVFKVKKVPIGVAILNFVPFYNYIAVRKYLYGKCLIPVIMSILTGLCFGFRFLALAVWASTDPWMMLVSVYASLAGIILWYLTMAYTACYTSILTRRGVLTIVLGTLVPFLGAFIVSKNIRAFFAQSLEVNSEFRVDNEA